MTRPIRQGLVAVLVTAAAAAAVAACAHAPPATGDRRPDAGIDPDNPEINCGVNNTADCRPAAGP